MSYEEERQKIIDECNETGTIIDAMLSSALAFLAKRVKESEGRSHALARITEARMWTEHAVGFTSHCRIDELGPPPDAPAENEADPALT